MTDEFPPRGAQADRMHTIKQNRCTMTERILFFLFIFRTLIIYTHTHTIFKYTQHCVILCVYIDREKTVFIEEINVHLCTNNKTYLNNRWYSVLLCVIVISWQFSRRSPFGNLDKHIPNIRDTYQT